MYIILVILSILTKALPARDINYEKATEGYNTYKSIIDEMSINYNIDKSIIVALIAYESNFKPSAQGTKRCRGLMQVQDGTFNPVLNIKDGCRIFARYRGFIRKRYPDAKPEYILLMSLTAYNMGAWHKRVKRGLPNKYAKDVLRISKKMKAKL